MLQGLIVTSFTLWFNAFFHINSYSLMEEDHLTSNQKNFLEKTSQVKRILFLPMQKRAANSCPIWNMLKESDVKSHRPTPNSQLYNIFDIAA
ncbi:hypothetical protein [Brevibacillus sp. SKDU10]|uniref:hypothetical protein n=1 Tax=Brevibacillus sp. SKDU10 TaxID=1247872 RepID=UPI0012F736DC|nr:hypothetical protein [Brevibacillus sp. SKDU10]